MTKKLPVHLLAWLPLPLVLFVLILLALSVQLDFRFFLKGTLTRAEFIGTFIRLMCIYSIIAGNQWVLRNKGFYRIALIASIVSSLALATYIILSNRYDSFPEISFALVLCGIIPVNVFCQRKLAVRKAHLQSEPIPSIH